MRGVTAMTMAVGAFFGVQSAAQATVRIDIDLTHQHMHVAADSGAAYDWPISSGRPGHATPRGVFGPQRMYRMIHSIKYDNAPMPHAIFFTGGYAIHGTTAVGMLGHVASHGCVRLHPDNATVLFDLVQREGATIHIGGDIPGGAIAANPHKAGHRLAFAHRKHMQEMALGYAPVHHHKTLKQWLRNPVGNR